jgi:hypothetical protein
VMEAIRYRTLDRNLCHTDLESAPRKCSPIASGKSPVQA